MIKTSLVALSAAICLLMTGCTIINIGWNHARVGLLSDYEFSTNGIHYVSADTIGIYIKWAPDINWKDWATKWPKENTKDWIPQLAP